MALRQWFSSIRSITSFLGQPVKAAKLKKSPRSGFALHQLEDRWVPSVVSITDVNVNNPVDLYVPIATSADGNLVAFQSHNDLLIDTNSSGNIYLKNISTNSLTLVSTKSDNSLTTTGSSTSVTMSADGRYIVFTSTATDLVAGDTNDVADIFVKDIQTGTTTLVSSQADGTPLSGFASSHASISADGRYIVFQNHSNIYVKEWMADGTGTLTRVNTDNSGNAMVGSANAPSISADGSKIAFMADDGQNAWKIYVKEWNPDGTGALTLVSSTEELNLADGATCYDPKISSDGNFVAFYAGTADLNGNDPNHYQGVYVTNLTTGAMQLVSTSSAGVQADGYSINPSISADGRFVVFESTATNLVAGAGDGNTSNIYVKDLQTGEITLLSRGIGIQLSLDSYNPVISADGNYVVFGSYLSNLVSNDTNDSYDLFRATVVGPTDILLDNSAVSENLPVGTVVGILSTKHINPSETFTYTLVAGDGDADNSVFQIEGDQLLTKQEFDYESRESYSVRIRTEDSSGESFEKVFTISVDDVVGPTITSPSTASVEENTTAVLTVVANTQESVDPDAMLTYSIVGGADGGFFQIDSTTGELSFMTPPDYENPLSALNTNTYVVTVGVWDGNDSSEQNITVTVTNMLEQPVFISPSTASVAENTTPVLTVEAELYDSQVAEYSIAGGADASFFQIDANTGELSFLTAPDYETPLSAANNNTYTVIVEVSDGFSTVQQQITVEVTNVVEPPVFTSPSAVNFAENTTGTVVVVQAESHESIPPSLTYALDGGPDASLFEMNAVTGELGFLAAPDYENPRDATNANTYHFTVKVMDGTNTVRQNITVTVTNVNEAPTDIGLSNTSVSTGAAVGSVVGVLSTTDPDFGDTFTYELVNDAGGIFSVSNGELILASNISTSQASYYSITLRTTDAGGLSDDKSFDIEVTNSPPVVSSIADQTVVVGGKLGPISFEVNDAETPVTNLLVTVTSSNQDVLPDSKVILGGYWYTRTLTLYPVQTGTSTITVTVKDGSGLTTTQSFTVTSLSQWPGGYEDNFAGGNAGNLGPNWLIHTGSAVLDNHAALSTAPVTVATVYGLTQKDTVLEATVTVGTSQTSASSLVARYSGASVSPNMYLGSLVFQNGSLHSRISKVVNGVATTLSESTAIPISAQYDLRFEVIDDSLKLYVNNTLTEFAYDTSLTTAGLSGMRLTNGNRLANFSANDIAHTSVALPPVPSQTTVDEFTLDDGAQLSRNWTDRLGNLNISDSQVVGRVSSSNLSTLNMPVTSDVGAQVDVNLTASGQSVGIALRYSGQAGAADQNMYWGALQWLQGTNQQAVIYRNINGVWTLLASAQLSGTGGVLRFEATGSALKLFVDGQRVLTAYDSNLNAGVVGLRTGIGGLADNFYAYKTSANVEGDSFTDSFDDSLTHQLAPIWRERTGAFALDANTAQGTLSGANTAVLNGITAADVVVTAVIQPQAGQLRSTGLVARYSGVADDNMYWGALNVYTVGSETKYIAQIWKNVDGIWTCLNSNAVPLAVADAVGKELRFEVVGTSLKLFLGDQLYSFAHDSSISTAGSVGIRMGSGAALDDFTYSVLNRNTPSVVNYVDTFDAGLNPRNTLSNDWQEQSGFISVASGHAVGGAASQPNSATLVGVDEDVVTLSADLYFTGANQTVQLLGKYQGKNGAGEDNMLLASVTTQANGDLLVRLVKIVHGVNTELQRATVTAYFIPGEFSSLNPELMFQYAGNSLTVFVDGDRVVEAIDGSLVGGSAGIRMTAGAGLDHFHATQT